MPDLTLERFVLAHFAPGVAPVAREWNDDVLGLRRKRRFRAAPTKKKMTG